MTIRNEARCRHCGDPIYVLHGRWRHGDGIPECFAKTVADPPDPTEPDPKDPR